MIIIEKKYSGLNKDIKLNKFNNNWQLDDDLFNLNKLLTLEKIEIIDSIEKQYKNILSMLNIDNANWLYFLGQDTIKKNLSAIKNKIEMLDNNFNSKYESIISKRIMMTSNIDNCYYDNDKYEKPVYDHVSSVTGRTKIVSGLNFLIMKKEDRHKLTSKFKHGRIYEIDIVSLEPRVLLKLSRDKICDDVYEHVAQNVLKLDKSRSKIKLGLISTLYGAKNSTVKKLSGLEKSQVEKIKEYFKIKELYQKLNSEFENHSRITNFYGRNIYSNNSMINHYIQSTAVDCAMIGFNNFLNQFSEGVNLVSTIHDAIIIDVHPDYFEKIHDTYEIYDDIMDIYLPVTIERLS
tara:strand:- start:161 stop:1204 length:1044 start_codon:yes stop_codon:yes gene_type:complete